MRRSVCSCHEFFLITHWLQHILGGTQDTQTRDIWRHLQLKLYSFTYLKWFIPRHPSGDNWGRHYSIKPEKTFFSDKNGRMPKTISILENWLHSWLDMFLLESLTAMKASSWVVLVHKIEHVPIPDRTNCNNSIVADSIRIYFTVLCCTASEEVKEDSDSHQEDQSLFLKTIFSDVWAVSLDSRIEWWWMKQQLY